MRHKRIKLNILSLFFIAVSLMSITLAWFAYSGIANTAAEVDVKAWYIEFEKDNAKVSNEIVLSLSDIYPGMDPVTERVNIKNLGDTDASLSYSITSARVLDEELDTTNVSTDVVADKLSHDYPFHVNIDLSKDFVRAKDDVSQFQISISWPLDSANNELDSTWGNAAYAFQAAEAAKKENNESYQILSSVRVVIEVKAEQYVLDNEAVDLNYKTGDLILYDIKENSVCSQLSDTCLKTYVLDTDSKVGDTDIALLPDLFSTYASSTYVNYDNTLSSIINNWNVTTRALTVDDLLKIVSKDITDSYIVRDNLSDLVIGKLDYGERLTEYKNLVTSANGFYRFLNESFPYLTSSKCYWLNSEYNSDKAFALTKIDDTYSKIYGEDKTSECSVVPVIIVPKVNLNS